MWRGDVRLSMSVPAPFVWRCLSGSTVAPFPHPAHRTGHADFPHPALGQDFHLVTSMTAPVASGWSDLAGWGLHPLESAALSRRTREADIPTLVE
jgi:hypothetical protein